MDRKIAVLLAAYNGEQYLNEQIVSILRQEKVLVDIFISLDKSSDRSLQCIEELSNNHNNIKLLSYGESYGSAGQNFIRLMKEIDYHNYDYVAFSDQDDIWFKNKLFHAINRLSSSGCDGYSSNVTAFWEGGKEKLIKKSFPQTRFDFLFESAGPGCTFVLTQKLAISIHDFLIQQDSNAIWLHDWFCYAYARKNNFGWLIDEYSSMRYRQHSNNSVGANSGVKSFINRFKSVISGDAFEKVLTQASILESSDLKPIVLLKDRSFVSIVRLLLISGECRRSTKDKILFFFAVFSLMFRDKIHG